MTGPETFFAARRQAIADSEATRIRAGSFASSRDFNARRVHTSVELDVETETLVRRLVEAYGDIAHVAYHNGRGTWVNVEILRGVGCVTSREVRASERWSLTMPAHATAHHPGKTVAWLQSTDSGATSMPDHVRITRADGTTSIVSVESLQTEANADKRRSLLTPERQSALAARAARRSRKPRQQLTSAPIIKLTRVDGVTDLQRFASKIGSIGDSNH